MSTAQRTVAVVTVSDSCFRGDKDDVSGKLLCRLAASLGAVVSYGIIPDEEDALRRTLLELVDDRKVDFAFTTGGTGVSPRDVTPEATRSIVDKEIPGLSELMRIRTASSSPTSVLSRAVCGVRAKTLIINLPGSPRGVEECLGVILPLLPHANDMIHQRPHEHG